MSCCKIIIKNNSDKNSNYNYQRCDDAFWVYEEILGPGITQEFFCYKDTFSTEFKTIEVISVECDKIFPTRTPTNTPQITPSITPTLTSTPPVTPTKTIPVTPSNTPTSSPFINGNFEIVFLFPDFGNNLIRFVVEGTSLFKMNIDWGDGTSTFYDGLTTYYPSHTYNNSIGPYNCIISVNGVTYITSLDCSYSTNSVYNYIAEIFVNQLTSLEYLNVSNNTLAYVPYPLPSSLLYMFLGQNNISNFYSVAQPLPPFLYVLDLQYNQLSSFITTQPLPSGLTDLFLNNNPLTSFVQTQSLPNTLETFNLAGCSLDSLSLQNTVNFMNNTSYINGQNLNLSNQTTGGCINTSSPSWIQLSNQFLVSNVNNC